MMDDFSKPTHLHNLEVPPLSLPKFTFLIGPPPLDAHRRDLALAINSLDEEMLTLDFEEPFRAATIALFFDNAQHEHDLTDPSQRFATLSKRTGTADAFIADLRHWLCCDSGAFLADAAFRSFEANCAPFNVFKRFLFRDATIPDAAAFADLAAPHRSVLYIHCETMSQSQQTPHLHIGNHIWLPTQDVEENMALLRHELDP